jgi:hypothetical protein
MSYQIIVRSGYLVSEVMERSSAMRIIDTIYIDSVFVTPHATTERRSSILQSRNRSGQRYRRSSK